MAQNSTREGNRQKQLDSKSPYPRAAQPPKVVAWHQRLPWAVAPVGSFVANLLLAKLRPNLDWPLGFYSPALLAYTFFFLLAVILWLAACVVALMDIIASVTRIQNKEPWIAAVLSALGSAFLVLASGTAFLYIYVGPG